MTPHATSRTANAGAARAAAGAAELIRLYTISEADQAFIMAHRGMHNRLGVSVQLASLRFPAA
ncbi:DUF4158 domain-containing protein [Neobacillus sp. YIM B02564]|jgi:TnpA family transposase|uniref:DUF4158 domain-containing protein n=1 Tax=Neobacillus paridis TaxID=2803862 RepID=A0ABS1TR47_9BACI|nr:DUF4158 domain-containing protein [Neobacillus paridis]